MPTFGFKHAANSSRLTNRVSCCSQGPVPLPAELSPVLNAYESSAPFVQLHCGLSKDGSNPCNRKLYRRIFLCRLITLHNTFTWIIPEQSTNIRGLKHKLGRGHCCYCQFVGGQPKCSSTTRKCSISESFFISIINIRVQKAKSSVYTYLY